jgi:hypothetical protein
MKHVVLTQAWKYNMRPYPAFRCNLNPREPTAVLHIEGVTPVLDVHHKLMLPEGHFRVRQYPYHTAYYVQAGQDSSDSCLLFVGHTGKQYDRIYLDEDMSMGMIVMDYLVRRNEVNRLELITILQPDQSIAFHLSGPRSNEVWRYQWNGTRIIRSVHINRSVSTGQSCN